ncbi:MAG: 4-alpha-glucanotransferase, partial [Natronospirillum sp.]
MANPELVARLAWHRKMGDSFVNYLGQEEIVPVERKERMLTTLGYKIDNDAALEAAIFELDGAPWTQLLRPVYVITAGASCGIEFHVPDPTQHQPLAWSITLEGGSSGPSGEALPAQLHGSGEYWIGETRYLRFFLPLPAALALGYHRIDVQHGQRTGQASLIMAPTQSFQGEAMANGEKIWGTAIQLYTLRSDNNWGMGDFSDLETLIRDMSALGAGFVGLNPIHSLYPISPEHASPYSPSNRSFINPMYIDVPRVPDFQLCAKWQKKLATKTFQQRLTQLRTADYVDYTQISDLKYDAFAALFGGFKKQHWNKDTERGRAFAAFVVEGGDPLLEHATFEALLAHFKTQDVNAWGWPVWPEAYRNHHSVEVQAFIAEHAAEVAYYQYLQFIADEQLTQVNAAAERSGMTLGLYRDLAVGADRGGAEVWSNKEMFCINASVGAPPDALGPTGQNWGLPPLDPVKLEADGYQSFITLVRNNMRGCGALRIDHAMSLFRLWWCPPGADASEGVYMHYNLDHLLGILNLESQRNHCMVIAEDLGTVPDAVVERFPEAQLYSNKVFYFETSPAGTLHPNEYAQKSLTIVANHDMPTLRSFWNKSDLQLRRTLSMFPTPESFDAEWVARDGAKVQILLALGQAGVLPEGMSTDPQEVPEMTHALSFAIHQFLASGSAQLVAVQLEDVMLVNDPVNVPGTSTEYPNWRRKLTLGLAEVFAQPAVREFAKRMT